MHLHTTGGGSSSGDKDNSAENGTKKETKLYNATDSLQTTANSLQLYSCTVASSIKTVILWKKK